MLEYINIFVIIFSIVLAVFLLFVAMREKNIIGWLGEHWVKQELRKLPKDKYKIINDILLKNSDRMCQIDHIVVSPYGIFVIETKQYNGFIVGGKYDKKWIRYSGKKKYYYENPIRQNYGHCMMIKELLKLDDSCVFNVVCIPSRAKLRIKHNGELTRNITIVEKILSYKEEKLKDYNELFETIKMRDVRSKKLRRVHVKNIKKNIV